MSPSDVSTPFGRRFTNEHARSLEETRAIHNAVTQQYQASVWSRPEAVERTSRAVLDIIREELQLPAYPPLFDALDACQQDLLGLETQIFTSIEADLSQPITLRAHMELNTALRERQFFFEHEDEVCDLLIAAFQDTAQVLAVPCHRLGPKRPYHPAHSGDCEPSRGYRSADHQCT